MVFKFGTGSVISTFAMLACFACSAGSDDNAGDETQGVETLGAQALGEETLGVSQQALTIAQATTTCSADPRVTLGLTSLDVCVGAELFFRDTFGGNGRSCGSCHPAANNYTIDPAFINSLPAGDKLFVAEQDPNLAQLERPDLMRDFGLILENVDGLQDPTNKFVMRSVPHCFSLGTSITAQAVPTDGTTRPPNERTGWGGDGAPNNGELRDFQTGAITQHYTKTLARVAGQDFVLANAAELDAIRAFSATIARTNEIDLNTVSLTNANAEAGRATFISAPARCNGCHRNAGANNGAAFNRNFNTGVENLRIAELDAQGIPSDGGFGGAGLAAFNFDSDGDGTLDSFGNGTFSTPPLIEAADTGPFFHTNAFDTIEDAIGFYNTAAFNQSPAGLAGTPIALSATQIANLGSFLRVLNVAFNAQIAIKRVSSVISIIDGVGNQSLPVQKTLLSLAREEVQDAIALLSPFPLLNTASRAQLIAASALLQTASTQNVQQARRALAQAALTQITTANSGLGSGMSFTMGQGTLMF
jgi:cytochrome c peroxidase